MTDTFTGGIVYGRRKATDIFMCIIFLVFFCGMFATAAYGYAKGDPVKLLTPFDSRGNQCGLSGTKTEPFKYLWWPDLYKAVNSKSVSDVTKGVMGNSYCVKSCPKNFT